MSNSDFVKVMQDRGFIHQAANLNDLDELATREMITGYIGFDCTAKSLHVGSLVPIMMLYWLQQTGNAPIALMGGGTTQVGDPSGKDKARKLLTADEISKNMTGIQKVFDRFLQFGDGVGEAKMVDNSDWLTDLNWLQALRDIGRHLSVNRMQTMDSVKRRMEGDRELSFLEFNYMVMQAYDFVALNRRYGCRLQMGGSDQWGNIMMGLELGHKMRTDDLFAITTPLLETSSGSKMGKTAEGAVWLDADMLAPFDYWQYWRNTEDADVCRFLKLFTTLPLSEIDRFSSVSGRELNDAKKVLALEATALVHGRETACRASETSRLMFEEGKIATSWPTIEFSATDLANGIGVLQAFTKAGLVASNSDARRQIKAKALKINGELVQDDRSQLTSGLARDGMIKLSFGKKKHAVIRVS